MACFAFIFQAKLNNQLKQIIPPNVFLTYFKIAEDVWGIVFDLMKLKVYFQKELAGLLGEADFQRGEAVTHLLRLRLLFYFYIVYTIRKNQVDEFVS